MRKKMFLYYLMVIPVVLLFFSFHTYPVIMGIVYSFSDWNGLREVYHFVGFKNYLNVFKDNHVYEAYWFTFKFAVTTTLLVNVIGLLVALGLNSRIKFKNMFRAIYFLPNVLSMLIVGFIFNYIFANILPDLFTGLHMEDLAVNLLGRKDYAWLGIVIVTVWQATAFNIILYLAGIQTIPTDLYEASKLDGAGRWKEFWHITFPLLAPFFTINMVLSMKNFMFVIDQIFALTTGGPGNATTSISYLIYTDGFQGGSFAYASANSVIFLVVIAVISIVLLKFLQKREMSA